MGCHWNLNDFYARLENLFAIISDSHFMTKTTRKGWEHSGSVVECLTRDRGAVGLSLTGITVFCP